ncbi:hypothetical protein [Roseibium sp.]|uniref:hypothetical protein n=1 Tax=Roseibium sp. TaxID=1936156 RepID=UPI003B51B656
MKISRPFRRRLFALPLASCLLVSAALLLPMPKPASAQTPLIENTLLGIGICPPWHPQSVEVCRNSVETVLDAFSARLDISAAGRRMMLNEGASAANLKKTVMELANTLGPSDRLIIYANLPSTSTDQTDAGENSRQILQLWADHEPETTQIAIETGTWVSAPAFAAMLHTVPAGEVILILDTNNSDTIDAELLEKHATNLDERPEALVTSAGAGQKANFSADRTIALFAKHLAVALEAVDGTLADVIQTASAGTRQAAIPICISLKENQSDGPKEEKNCTQVPEIHDPAGILGTIAMPVIVAASNGN